MEQIKSTSNNIVIENMVSPQYNLKPSNDSIERRDDSNDESSIKNVASYDEINNLITHNNIDIKEEVPQNNNLNKPKPERKYWVDALRIYASFLVIQIHYTGQCRTSCDKFKLYWDIGAIWDAFARSCVPLFVMISGIFFLNPKKELTLSKLFKKNIYRITKSLLFWNTFYVTVSRFLVNEKKKKFTWDLALLKVVLKEIFLGGKYHLWYLYMCIGLYILTPTIRPITANKLATKYYIIFSVGILSSIQFTSSVVKDYYPDNGVTNYIDEFIKEFTFFFSYQYISYYILGYYLSQITIKSKTKLYLIYLFGIISICLTCVIKISLSHINKKESNNYTESNWSFNIAVYTIATFIFFKHTINNLLEKLLKYKIIKTLVKTLSDLSFGVYLIHVFYLELFRRFNIRPYVKHTYITIPLFTTIIWILCNITIYIIKKIKILRDFV